MARPKKSGIDYFPLDTDLPESDFIFLLEETCGTESFGTLCKILCKIYKEEGYYMIWDDKKISIFARKSGVSSEKLKAVVKTQADYDAVLAGMERFCAEVRRKGTEIEYLPYFSTWVNARRWEDGDDLPLPSVPSESRRDSEDLGDMAKRLGLE